MQFSLLQAAALSMLAVQVSAKTIKIDVGKSGDKMDPNQVNKAEKGDVLEFHFGKDKHSVVQGDFQRGCYAVKKDGFNSGVQTSPATFSVNITNTDPIFYYSSVDLECQAGMVGVVNPSFTETLDKYQKTAKISIKNESPNSEFGGTLGKADKDSAAGELYKPITGLLAVAVGVAAALV